MWSLPDSPLTLAGVISGWAASLTPSLLPRPWVLQGIVSGIGILIGFAVGVVLESVLRLPGARASHRISSVASKGLLALALAVMVWAVGLQYIWQSDVRALLGIEGSPLLYLITALAAGLLSGYVLITLVRMLHRGWQWLVDLVGRQTSRRAAPFISALVVLAATGAVVDELVVRQLLPAVGERFQDSYERLDSEVARPVSAAVSGSPDSLVGWDDMGRQGRAFVAAAPAVSKLEDFAEDSVTDPVRVYVGLRSAGTVEERVSLAIQEMDRTGAFDRHVILMLAPTGTGWVDPYSVAPMELMYGGDTAAVAVQYSNLPSWVLLAGNQDLAVETQQKLLAAIRERLDRLDAEHRPQLVLYGQSLGSFGQEAAFENFEEVVKLTDGALWVGPPRANRHWQSLMSRREAGSPIWRPVVDGGRTVRFGPDLESWLAISEPWPQPRVVYLQHPSDPITWLSLDMLVRRPEWLDAPRGQDVSRWMPFMPVITFLQVGVDLAVGTSVPLGHGHKFGSDQSDAWASILPPDGWGTNDTSRLRDAVDEVVGR